MTIQRVEIRRTGRAADQEQPVTYDGPFGPISGAATPGRTDLSGPAVGTLSVAWGVGSSQDVDARARLRDGIPMRLGTAEVTVRQPNMGLTRSRRVVEMAGAGRSWRWRHRGVPFFGLNHFERADGATVAKEMVGGRIGIDESADEIEVGLVVLTWASFLVDRATPPAIW